MAVDIVVFKQGGALWPVTEIDKQSLRAVKTHQTFKVKAVQQSARSVEHHQLYWAGLVRLIADYWEPEAGCVTPNEEGIVNAFANHLCRNLGEESSDAILGVKDEFMAKVRRQRAAELGTTQEVELQNIHDWVKGELKMYDLYLTPAGWQKRLQSINFNAMSQEAFNEFYRNAFDVAWRFILSRQFDSAEDAEQAVNELLGMGN